MSVYIKRESSYVEEEAKATGTGIPNQTLRGLHHQAHEECSEHIFNSAYQYLSFSLMPTLNYTFVITPVASESSG